MPKEGFKPPDGAVCHKSEGRGRGGGVLRQELKLEQNGMGNRAPVEGGKGSVSNRRPHQKKKKRRTMPVIVAPETWTGQKGIYPQRTFRDHT